MYYTHSMKVVHTPRDIAYLSIASLRKSRNIVMKQLTHETRHSGSGFTVGFLIWSLILPFSIHGWTRVGACPMFVMSTPNSWTTFGCRSWRQRKHARSTFYTEKGIIDTRGWTELLDGLTVWPRSLSSNIRVWLRSNLIATFIPFHWPV